MPLPYIFIRVMYFTLWSASHKRQQRVTLMCQQAQVTVVDLILVGFPLRRRAHNDKEKQDLPGLGSKLAIKIHSRKQSERQRYIEDARTSWNSEFRLVSMERPEIGSYRTTTGVETLGAITFHLPFTCVPVFWSLYRDLSYFEFARCQTNRNNSLDSRLLTSPWPKQL